MEQAVRLEDRLGEIIREVEFPIERGKIAEFARAMHDDNPVYFDPEAAEQAGYTAIPAPLTFSVAAAHYASGDAMELPRKLGLDLERVVHGEERWHYHRPVVAGDVLRGVTRLMSIDRKTGRAGDMVRVLLTTTYVDAAGDRVLSETALIIELPPVRPDTILADK